MLLRSVRRLINYFYDFPAKVREVLYLKSYSLMRQYAISGEIASIHIGKESVVHLKDGRSFYYNPSSKIDRLYSLPFAGNFESNETEVCRKIVKLGNVCFDVGASYGWYSTLFSKLVGSEGHVYAFEPVKSNFESLKKNILLNNFSNVTANKLALGESCGSDTIFVSDVDTSGSLQLRDYKHSYVKEDVVITTIDKYVEDQVLVKIDFIKADIEGAELLMLRGAQGILVRCRPILFLEIQSHSTKLFNYSTYDVVAYLLDLGYRQYIVRAGHLVIAETVCHEKDYNFFFIHSEKIHLYGDVLSSIDV